MDLRMIAPRLAEVLANNCDRGDDVKGALYDLALTLEKELRALLETMLVAEQALDSVLCAATIYFPEDMLKKVSQALAAIEQARKE